MSFFSSYPLGQNGRHFADDIFKRIFVNEEWCILIKISLKFVSKGLIRNTTALIYITAWHRIADKPLSESILTQFTDTYMRHYGRWIQATIDFGLKAKRQVDVSAAYHVTNRKILKSQLVPLFDALLHNTKPFDDSPVSAELHKNRLKRRK